MKIIYIAGLYHTGSTLIDMLLGNLPSVVGLGEIFKGFHDKYEEQCSCGSTPEKCIFWGKVIGEIEKHQNLSIQEKYEITVSKFKEIYGSNFIMVDSSKCHPFKIRQNSDDRNMQGLEYLRNIPGIEIKVIHLVRDVRSWSNSLILRDRKDSTNHPLRIRLFRYFFRSPFARFVQWYWGHKRILKYIEINNLQHLRVSYEGLSIETKDTLMKICEFIDIAYTDEMLKPAKTNSHIIVGNPMRFRKTDIDSVKYDYRWFLSNKVLIPSLLLRRVMRLNKKLVYGK